MKKTVWTFGLIAGGILSVMMAITIPFHEQIGWDRAEVIGYATILAAFLLIFFGIRSYRDNVGGGAVTFGRAFAVGALISLIASSCYVLTWEVIYFGFKPDFVGTMQTRMVERARTSGKSQAEIDEEVAKIQRYSELYKNPALNAAITFIEPLPIGILIALISAGVLRRRYAAPA